MKITIYMAHLNILYYTNENAGIDIILVDIFKLKDTFPWYSPIWRTLIKPSGNPQNKGWIGNFYGPMWPKLTLRNLLRALNVKADHRKIFLQSSNLLPHLQFYSLHPKFVYRNEYSHFCQDMLNHSETRHCYCFLKGFRNRLLMEVSLLLNRKYLILGYSL